MTPDLMTQLRAKLAFKKEWMCWDGMKRSEEIAADAAMEEHARTAPIVEALLECAVATQRLLNASSDYQLQREAEEDAREALAKLERLIK